MNADVASICNITEQSWMIHRTYGTFQIRGCAAGVSPAGLAVAPAPHAGPAGLPAGAAARAVGEEAPSASGIAGGDLNQNRGRDACATTIAYALTPITPRKGVMDLGDKRMLEFPISAREIAEDIAREINADGGEDSFFGVFVCAGDAPTDAELAAAQARLGEFYVRLVSTADRNWERTHNWFMITDAERRAARWLGLEKEWCYEPKPLEECPACAERVKPGVAVCRACGAILDPEKAARFGLAAAAPAPLAGPAASGGSPSFFQADGAAPAATAPVTLVGVTSTAPASAHGPARGAASAPPREGKRA